MKQGNLKDLMMYYGVTMGRRFSLSEKNLFRKEIQNLFQNDTKIIGSGSIQIGDLESSKVLCIANLETPKKSLVNINYFPLSFKLNVDEEKKFLKIELIKYFILAGLYFIIFLLFERGSINDLLFYALVAVISIFYYFLFIKNRGNRYNFNRNSASLVLIHHLYSENNKGSKISAIFMDNLQSSNKEFEIINEYLKDSKYRGIVILLDCIADGNSIIISSRKSSLDFVDKTVKKLELCLDKKYDLIINQVDNEKIKDCPLQFIENMIIINSGSKVDDEFVVKNTSTKNDIKWNEKQLIDIESSLLCLID